MPTIDLTTPGPPPLHVLDGLPRRVTLALPELQLLAEQAGGAPLPFDLEGPQSVTGLEDRLGVSRHATDAAAYTQALATLADPADSLARRGLLRGGVVDPTLAGAIGLLAAPRVALDLDVSVDSVQARAWHRQSGPAVAALSTVDGVVFELAWFHTRQWAGELTRVAALADEVRLAPSAVPGLLRLPFELAVSAAEAIRSGRSDLVPVLVSRHPGLVSNGGQTLGAPDSLAALAALSAEARGRLRALVIGIGPGQTPVGVVSWTLLQDGWHALTAVRNADLDLVEVRRVEPGDLAAALAPALAEAVT